MKFVDNWLMAFEKMLKADIYLTVLFKGPRRIFKNPHLELRDKWLGCCFIIYSIFLTSKNSIIK